MANVIRPDWLTREVFATGELAEAAMLEAERTLGRDDPTLSFGWVPEGKLGRWAYVVVRRRGTNEFVGYLSPAPELSRD